MITEHTDNKVIYYIIMDDMEFHPDTHLIRSISSGEEVSLFTPASRCFELLLKCQGEAIPQRKLMKYAWAEHGLSVSPNTFYQNISLLRKSIAKLLPEENIIVTMKRTGWVIPEAISVNVFDNVGHTANSLLNELQAPSLEMLSVRNIEAHEQSNPSEKNKIKSIYSIVKRNAWLVMWSTYLVIAAIFFSALFFTPHSSVTPERELFKDYILYKQVSKNCSVYINSGAGNVDLSNRFLKIGAGDCRGYERVYVTLHEGSIRTSAMFCSITEINGMSCVSEYFARSQK